MGTRLPHERWDVYQRALELQALALSIGDTIRGKDPSASDQLTRASASILLNIAEGASEFGTKDKIRFYRYAKRSGFEVSALVNITRDPAVPPSDSDRALALAQHVVRAMTRLIRALKSKP